MKLHTLSVPISIVAALQVSTLVSAVPRDYHARATPGSNKTVILQLFEWSWDSVAAECTAFIGPAGYAFVQVSPAQEHVTGTQWWLAYQPVSYQLISTRGDRAQFADMVETCHAAGVKVIHDTVMNHMAAVGSGSGTARSGFTAFDFPGIYQYQDFHHCGLEPNDAIKNWTSRVEIQTCQLANLADLDTESEHVRATLAAHVNDLISLGVDGVRLDAAKHVAASSLADIMSRATSKIYVTQEFVYGSEISSAEYLQVGDVQEFQYTSALNYAFTWGNIADLQMFDNRPGWTPSGQANVFVSNHDTERSNGANSLNANSPSNTYILAHVFSLAHPYGSPSVLSSYTGFSIANGDADGPNSAYGTCSGTTGTNGWLCQHRWTPISGMVGFRNNVGAASPMTNWVSPTTNRIAFGRGTLGFVAINNLDSAWTAATFATSLPAGTYCDIVNGVKSSGTTCSQTTFTVVDGAFTATIPARSAIGLHTGAVLVQTTTTTTTTTTVAVTFTDNLTTQSSQNIFIVGSIPALGNWNPANAVALSSAQYPNCSATIILPVNTAIQYKFIRKDAADGSITWESDPNRQATTVSGGSQSLWSSWR